MTAPQAQTKFNQLSDFMNSHQGLINPDRLELRRWLKDARALRQHDPVEGYMMEGLVYRAQGNLVKGLEYLEKSYRLDRMGAGSNYASMLSTSGYYDEAEDIYLKLLDTDRANTKILQGLLLSIPHTLNKEKLTKAISIFRPTNPEAEKKLEYAQLIVNSMDNILYDLEVSGVSIKTYKRFWNRATHIRNSNYLGGSTVNVYCQINEIGTFLLVEDILQNVSIEDCLRMNDELVDALIEDDYPFEEYQKIIFDFVPADEAVEAA